MNRKDGLYTPKEQKEIHSTKQFLPSEVAHICLASPPSQPTKKRGGGCFIIFCSMFLGLDKPLYLLPPSHDSQQPISMASSHVT